MKIVKIKLLNRLWSIRFLPSHLMREGDNGTCWTSKRCIDIDNSLEKEETKLILTHELVHAFLGMCGRVFEREINDESICEFVSWHIDEIIKARDKILSDVQA